MDSMINKIYLLIDGETHIYHIKKNIYEHDTEYDLDIFQLVLNIGDAEYKSSSNYNCMEFAIIDLQKKLPDNIQIACCQTCKHGNYCPFGDQENQIFCLINYSPKNKGDVIDIFISNKHMIPPENKFVDIMLPTNELLHWCEKFDKINDDDYYTYNNWNYYFKKHDNS